MLPVYTIILIYICVSFTHALYFYIHWHYHVVHFYFRLMESFYNISYRASLILFCLSGNVFISLSFFIRFYLFTFLDKGEGREKERERNINMWLLLTHPLLGTWPTTQACALIGNRTSNRLVCRLELNLLSHTSQGPLFLKNSFAGYRIFCW